MYATSPTTVGVTHTAVRADGVGAAALSRLPADHGGEHRVSVCGLRCGLGCGRRSGPGLGALADEARRRVSGQIQFVNVAVCGSVRLELGVEE